MCTELVLKHTRFPFQYSYNRNKFLWIFFLRINIKQNWYINENMQIYFVRAYQTFQNQYKSIKSSVSRKFIKAPE